MTVSHGLLRFLAASAHLLSLSAQPTWEWHGWPCGRRSCRERPNIPSCQVRRARAGHTIPRALGRSARRGINSSYSQCSRANRRSRSGDGWVGQTGVCLGTSLLDSLGRSSSATRTPTATSTPKLFSLWNGMRKGSPVQILLPKSMGMRLLNGPRLTTRGGGST